MFQLNFILFLCLSSVFAAKLPASFKSCKKSTPDFNECLRAAIQGAFQSLIEPHPSVGLASLEPLEVESMTIGEGTGAVNVVQKFKNIKLHGLTHIKFDRAEMNFEKYVLKISGVIDELKQVADYDFNGRVLLLPIVGKGGSSLTLDNVKVTLELQFEKFQKKNKTFLKPIKYSIALEPTKVSFDLQNLFNGDKALGDNLLKVLNDNWQEIFKDVKEGYEKAYGDILKQHATNIFGRVPEEEIFPSS